MKTILVAGMLMISSSAIASDASVALKLGPVIASDKFCGLEFDHSKLGNYLAGLPVNDTAGFMQMLNSSIDLTTYGFNDMGDLQKLTHCTLAKRSATELGFLQ